MGKIINYLVCVICKSPLSVRPIFSYDDETICGRCPVPKDFARNTAFEILGASKKFKCRYENDGCRKKVTMKNALNHEIRCSYGRMTCPMPDCIWTCNFTRLIEHCTEIHPTALIKKNTKFEIDIKHSYSLTKYYIYKNDLFVILCMLDVEKKKLEFLVRHSIEEIKTNYYCLLTLKLGSRSFLTEFNTGIKTRIVYSELVEESSKPVTSIPACFIMECNPIEAVDAPKNTSTDQIIETLRCENCREFVFPPIYQTEDSLFFCRDCRQDLRVETTTSVALNRLASRLKYSCKYANNGCSIWATHFMLMEHQLDCQHKPVTCFLPEKNELCLWEGQLNALSVHLIFQHSDLQIDDDKVNVWDVSVPRVSAYIVWDLHCFRITMMNTTKFMSFLVQKLYASTEPFIYAIEIINFKNSQQRIILQQPCTPFTSYYDEFNDEENFAFLSQEQVRGFLQKKKKKNQLIMRLKIHISRENE